jgi:putative transposase
MGIFYLASSRLEKPMAGPHVTGHGFSHAVQVYNDSAFRPCMARPSRNSQFGSVSNPFPRTFFITSKTNGGRSYLQTERMATLLIDVLRSYHKAGKFKVHDFVVMPDHIHVLLALGPEMSVEKAAQFIKGGFSYRARKELHFKSDVWQNGFSEEQIKDEESFRQHQNYIDKNPVRAGLALSADEYPYCSRYLKTRKSAAAKAGK